MGVVIARTERILEAQTFDSWRSVLTIRNVLTALAMHLTLACMNGVSAAPSVWNASVVAGYLNLRAQSESRYGGVFSAGIRTSIDFSCGIGPIIGFQYGEVSKADGHLIRAKMLDLGLRMRMGEHGQFHTYYGIFLRALSIDEWLPFTGRSCVRARRAGWVAEMRRATHLFAGLEWHPAPTGMALGIEIAHLDDTNPHETSDLTGVEVRGYLSLCREVAFRRRGLH